MKHWHLSLNTLITVISVCINAALLFKVIEMYEKQDAFLNLGKDTVGEAVADVQNQNKIFQMNMKYLEGDFYNFRLYVFNYIPTPTPEPVEYITISKEAVK